MLRPYNVALVALQAFSRFVLHKNVRENIHVKHPCKTYGIRPIWGFKSFSLSFILY